MSKLKIAGIVLAVLALAVLVKFAWWLLTMLFWPLVVVGMAYVALNVAGKVPGPFRK